VQKTKLQNGQQTDHGTHNTTDNPHNAKIQAKFTPFVFSVTRYKHTHNTPVSTVKQSD
jgi:hypothetical protein